MSFGVRKIKTWQKQTAMVFSANSNNLPMMLREMVKRFNWLIGESVYPLSKVFEQVETGETTLLIIDDSEHYPVPVVLRQLLTHRVASLVPTLVLCSPASYRDQRILTSLGPHELLEKPLTPGKFIPAFEKVLANWSTGTLGDLREAAWQMAMGNEKTGLRELTELTKNPQASAYAAPCLALYFQKNQDYKTAEKVLLTALKNHPRSLGVIMALVGLYLNTAMPNMALKLLHGVESAFTNPRILYIDFMQAYLMLGQVDKCIPYLEDMAQTEFMTDIGRRFLPRVLYTEGHTQLFEKSIRNQLSTIALFKKAWSRDGTKNLAG